MRVAIEEDSDEEEEGEGEKKNNDEPLIQEVGSQSIKDDSEAQWWKKGSKGIKSKFPLQTEREIM